MFFKTYITIVQNVMLLPHSELLCLASARIAWTKGRNRALRRDCTFILEDSLLNLAYSTNK